MFDKLERWVGLPAALLTIGQGFFAVYKQLRNMPIPLWLYISSVLTALIIGLFLGYRHNRKLKANSPALKKIGRITFDYLPDSPLNNGWTLQDVNAENGTLPNFFASPESPIPGGIKILKRDRYALDYSIEQIQSLANMVELYAKFENDARFYLKVKLSSRDGGTVQCGWLAYNIGQGNPIKPFQNEWQIPVQGDILENEWVQLKLPIEDDVQKTFGRDGLIFQGLIGFRIRGSISISPVTMYKIGLSSTT